MASTTDVKRSLQQSKKGGKSIRGPSELKTTPRRDTVRTKSTDDTSPKKEMTPKEVLEKIVNSMPLKTYTSSEMAARSLILRRNESMTMSQFYIDRGIVFEPLHPQWLAVIGPIHGNAVSKALKTLLHNSQEYPPELGPMLNHSDKFTVDQDSNIHHQVSTLNKFRTQSELFGHVAGSLSLSKILDIVDQVTSEVEILGSRTTNPTETEWIRVWNMILVACYPKLTESTQKSSPPKPSFWQEHFINYSMFDLRSIADKNQLAAVHTCLASNIFAHHIENIKAIFGENFQKYPPAIVNMCKWLLLAGNHLAMRDANVEKNIWEAHYSHARFHNRIGTYPPHGRYDGAVVLNDDNFFNDLVKEINVAKTQVVHTMGDSYDPWNVAEEKLSTFECCVTRRAQFDPPRGRGKKASGPQNIADEKEKKREFLIPLLMIEHKRQDADEVNRPIERAGRNQRLMYVTSAARFLLEMGIVQQPVFGLSTAGPRSSFCISWYSAKETSPNKMSVPHITDSEVGDHCFDLRKKEDIVRCIMFLFSIGNSGKALWEEYMKSRNEVIRKLSLPPHSDDADTITGDKYGRWTLFSQREDLGIQNKDGEDLGIQDKDGEDLGIQNKDGEDS